MPFKSESQRKYLWATHPEIAKRWTKEYGSKPTDHKTESHTRLKKVTQEYNRRKK